MAQVEKRAALIRTLDLHHRGGLDDAEIAGGRARVIGGLLNVGQH